MKKKLNLIFVLAVLAATQLVANNLNIDNVTIHPVSRRLAVIQMDLSWENSWRDACNHDAAWLFAKYSLDGGVTWSHATLKGSGVTPTQTSPGSDASLQIYVPDDCKGAFVRRTAEGSGTLATTGLRLAWDLEADSIPPDALGRISMHGLEVVYIPKGPFYVGDNASQINRGFKVTYINTPAMTNTTAAGLGTIEVPYTNMTAGIGRPYGIAGTFTNRYPNGYNAFYIMKYELSRRRYLDFLNQLTFLQATNLMTNLVVSQAYTFEGTTGAITGTHRNFANTHSWRAVTFRQMTTPTFNGAREWLAYLDWAGLRPITEMEYEKACRGPNRPVDNGFPWGTTAGLLINRLKALNTAAESPSVRGATLIAGGFYGTVVPSYPLRNGALADATTDQFQAGASYYGVLEMAGNVCEKCVVSYYHAVAAAYSGLHGDGALNADGTANVRNWPYQTAMSAGGGSITSRGGGVGETVLNCTISAKGGHDGCNYYPEAKQGIRGARSVP